jgi:GntR family transcriptional regulator
VKQGGGVLVGQWIRRAGLLKAGQPVPSITTLTQDHGVARQTAAKAPQMLESEGLVYRVPGLGYYVTEHQ